MNVQELMIGDRVFSPKLQKVFKVMGIENDHDEIKSVGCHIPMRILEPIPLTEEILKANGFVRSGMFMSRRWNNNDVVYADGSFDNNINISTCGTDYHAEYINIRIPHIGIGMPLYYVHELQHALRLCGLNDLANNFKIKQL